VVCITQSEPESTFIQKKRPAFPFRGEEKPTVSAGHPRRRNMSNAAPKQFKRNQVKFEQCLDETEATEYLRLFFRTLITLG